MKGRGAVGLAVMLIIWFANGGGGSEDTQRGDDLIGTVLLNMAVFGAMLSYIMQGVSFIVLRRMHLRVVRRPGLPFCRRARTVR